MKDDITNDLLQFLPNVDLHLGEPTKIIDPLIAPDTWVNSLWIGHDYQYAGLNTANSLKWEFYHHRLNQSERDVLDLEERDYFFGVINKASYRFELGRLWIEPRWKSEYRKQTLDLVSPNKREELAEIGGVILAVPILSHTTFQAGLELTFLNDLVKDDNDFNGVAAACLFTNASDYLGYKLITQAGLKIDRRDPRGRDPRTITQSFITVYAGLE